MPAMGKILPNTGTYFMTETLNTGNYGIIVLHIRLRYITEVPRRPLYCLQMYCIKVQHKYSENRQYFLLNGLLRYITLHDM